MHFKTSLARTKHLADTKTDFTLEESLVESILAGSISHFESALAMDFKALSLLLIEDKRGYSSCFQPRRERHFFNGRYCVYGPANFAPTSLRYGPCPHDRTPANRQPPCWPPIPIGPASKM